MKQTHKPQEGEFFHLFSVICTLSLSLRRILQSFSVICTLSLSFKDHNTSYCTLMASCCKHWWHASVYSIISLLLAFIAISTALRSNHKNAIPATKPVARDLQLNVCRALRRAGFHTMATLLQLSPELFLSSPNSTIFVINDSAISYLSIPPLLLKDLLQYHTTPSKLSMNDLLKKPQGSCFPTLHRKKKIAITKIDARQSQIEINNVLVSHPDVFLEGPIAVHGVLGPFSPLNFIKSPICDNNSTLVSDFLEPNNIVEWSRIIQLLSSYGFVSFAISLRSVLDGILEDQASLNTATIFAPPNLAVVASSSLLLDKIVRFHILPRRLTYKELTSLPVRTLLRTLAPGQDLEVNFKEGLIFNGVEIAAPDLFSSEKFVVHGVSRAFELTEFS